MVHNLVIRYVDYTFDFIKCDETDFPALLQVVEGASCDLVHMPADAEYPWNEAYLAQPWKVK